MDFVMVTGNSALTTMIKDSQIKDYLPAESTVAAHRLHRELYAVII